MKEFLEAIIVNLVNDKGSIVITEEQKENLVEYKVKVASDDMGKVIGKQGKTANAIRTLIKSLAGAQNKKVNIESFSGKKYEGIIVGYVPAQDNDPEIEEISIKNDADNKVYSLFENEVKIIKILEK